MRNEFDPKIDIPDLNGNVILVTGGNSGLGEATITSFAQHNPSKIYLAARSRSKALLAVDRIRRAVPRAKIDILELDLASFDSIRAAAARVNIESSRLDILHLTGGVCVVPHGVTKEGYEIQSGTNYMGHVLLTQLLIPKLLTTAKISGADVRIVLMSSVAHKGYSLPKDGIDWNVLKTDMRDQTGFQLYDLSMLTKVLFGYALAEKYPQFTVSSVHPGLVKTNVVNGEKSANFLMPLLFKVLTAVMGVSAEEGAKNQIWCSISKSVKSGNYYEPIGKAGKQAKFATDKSLVEGLWGWTADELLDHGGPGWMVTV